MWCTSVKWTKKSAELRKFSSRQPQENNLKTVETDRLSVITAKSGYLWEAPKRAQSISYWVMVSGI